MQFRLRTLFLLLFVLASALAAFGAWGLLVTPYLIALVMSVRIGFAWRNVAAWVIAGALILVWPCIGLLLPVSGSAREAVRRPVVSCVDRLEEIGSALRIYHYCYGCYPPAYVPDDQGRPMHSWRVLILPLLEEQALHDQYDFSEPWNGPHNRKLAENMPRAYACPQATKSAAGSKTATSFIAITGPGTAWPGPTSSRIRDFRDGTSCTILLVEAADAGINWMEPRDLELSALLAASGSDSRVPAGNHGGGGIMLFGDDSVGGPCKPLGKDLLAALATINDGKPVNRDEVDKALYGVHYGKVALPPKPKRWWPTYLAAVVFLVSLILLVSHPLPSRSMPDATNGNGRDSQD
ncbi:MAG: DUF1559 domain-containing protein [Pirellulales bacterium]|nr:DUF1559 domain-containing protein [Pirellulales bacterium]